MYPQRELNALAIRKAELIGRIGLRRASCVTATVRVVAPLKRLDNWIRCYRRWSPLVTWTSQLLGRLLTRSSKNHTTVH